MAKLNLPDIGTLANTNSARQAINDNFTAIEAAIDNSLSRDGTTPNQMEADIDLNSNDLLNVGRIDAFEIYKNGVPFEQSVAYADKRFQLLSGTGVATEFVLQQDPASLGNLSVFLDGAHQKPGVDYTYSGTTLTFATPAASGTNNIIVRYDVALPVGTAIAQSVQLADDAGVYTANNVEDALNEVSGRVDTVYTNLASTDAGKGGSLVRIAAAGVGAVARGVTDKLGERPSVLDYIDADLHAGLAAGTETGDQSAGFNAALTAHKDVFVPAGTYYLTAMVTIPLGHRLVGAGKRKTLIKVPATFDLSALGVLRLAGGEPGGEIHGLTIEFVQPDSATLADYTQYPPAIYAVGCPRFAVKDVRIALAWDGINMTGNSGGAVIDGLELSMFNKGVLINGALDSVKINGMHLWPFGPGNAVMTANQRTHNAAAYGIYTGRCDDLHLSNSLLFDVRKALYCYRGAGAADYTFGTLSNVSFDGDGGLHVITDGRLSLAACYFSKDSADGNWFNQSGGIVRIVGSRFVATGIELTANGGIEVSGGTLSLVGCRYERGSMDNRLVYATNSAVVNITGGEAISNSDISFTKPAIHYAGSNAGAVTGLYAPPKGTGTGGLISIAGDSGVVVTGIAAEGWGISGPATRNNTIVTNNIGPEHDNFAGCVAADGTSNGLPSGWTCARITAGNYTVTHNRGLNAVRDIICVPVCEAGDSVAVWDVLNSTTSQFRIRVQTGGVAADEAFSFIARRRR